jgi:predicted nucleic acid-binding protein
MRKYLIDTGPFVALLRGRQGAINHLEGTVKQGEVVTSMLVYGEVIEYLHSFPNFHDVQTQVRGLLHKEIRPLAVTYAVGEQYATIRRTMRQMRTAQGKPLGLIGDIDTIIAATAITYNLTIITMDSDYQRIPGLSVRLFSKVDLQ